MSPRVSLLQASGVTCYRGETCLFESLGFELMAGEALQVEGANGAGKTSLLRIVAGMTLPDEGDVLWRGEKIQDRRPEFNAQLAYLGHHLGLKYELTVEENLRAAVVIQGAAQSLKDLPEVLFRVGLAERADLPVRVLSAGQKQRVALARMLLIGAVLWVLDEPFTALDASGIGLIGELLEQHLDRGGLAVMTSHQAIPLGSRLRRLIL